MLVADEDRVLHVLSQVWWKKKKENIQFKPTDSSLYFILSVDMSLFIILC